MKTSKPRRRRKPGGGRKPSLDPRTVKLEVRVTPAEAARVAAAGGFTALVRARLADVLFAD